MKNSVKIEIIRSIVTILIFFSVAKISYGSGVSAGLNVGKNGVMEIYQACVEALEESR